MTVAELIEKLVVFLVEEPDNFQSVKSVELLHVGQPYMDGFFKCLSPSA